MIVEEFARREMIDMNVLIVYAHPNPESFNHAIVERITKGVGCEFLFTAESRGFRKLVKIAERATMSKQCEMSTSFCST